MIPEQPSTGCICLSVLIELDLDVLIETICVDVGSGCVKTEFWEMGSGFRFSQSVDSWACLGP